IFSVKVIDVAETARLRAGPEDRQRLAAQRLAHQVRHDAAVVEPHPWAESVEDPYYPRIDPVVTVVGHRHGLGEALAFVVTTAHADGVDMAPVVLPLRVDFRVAVNLAGAGEQ